MPGIPKIQKMKLKYIITLAVSSAIFTSCDKANKTDASPETNATDQAPASDSKAAEEAEAKAIVAEVEKMMAAFNQGNAELLVKKTHPALYKLIPGDKEDVKKTMLDGAKQIMDLGIKIDSFKAEEPDKLYKAGKESVCFVPMSSVMTMQGQKIASSSFMIAAKGEAGEWMYLDGSMAGANPEILYTLFPDLPKDIKLPEMKMEPLP